MTSFLTITAPAASLALLSIAELRAAAGVTGTDQDAELVALGLRVAASIMSECNIAVGVGGEPTLWQETLTETFYQACGEKIILSRRHNVQITSVTADGATMDADNYLVDPQSGILRRLCNDLPIKWDRRKVVVVYKAGFTQIPGDLKQASIDFVRFSWLESKRDPALKSEVVDIPDVERMEKSWWVGSVPGQSNEGAVPDVVSGQLKRFRNLAIG